VQEGDGEDTQRDDHRDDQQQQEQEHPSDPKSGHARALRVAGRDVASHRLGRGLRRG
jgi:hypothetical protein